MFLDKLFGSGVEKRTQFFCHDNGDIQFRQLELEDACLVEKTEGKTLRAWPHFFTAEIPFDGYKKIRADQVTIGFNRDFILDPFNKVQVTAGPTGGKPAKSDPSIKRWTAQVAEGQRYKVMNKPGNMLLVDKITMFLGIGFILMLLMFGLTKAWGG